MLTTQQKEEHLTNLIEILAENTDNDIYVTTKDGAATLPLLMLQHQSPMLREVIKSTHDTISFTSHQKQASLIIPNFTTNTIGQLFQLLTVGYIETNNNTERLTNDIVEIAACLGINVKLDSIDVRKILPPLQVRTVDEINKLIDQNENNNNEDVEEDSSQNKDYNITQNNSVEEITIQEEESDINIDQLNSELVIMDKMNLCTFCSQCFSTTEDLNNHTKRKESAGFCCDPPDLENIVVSDFTREKLSKTKVIKFVHRIPKMVLCSKNLEACDKFLGHHLI